MTACFLTLALCISAVQTAFDVTSDSDEDLTSFVSRPDIKVPLLDVNVYDEQATSPGYWFLGPYTSITQQPHPKNVYQACQIGPAIYDDHGGLVWSGACDVRNQNSVDFRPVRINGSDHLSLILNTFVDDPKGHGIVLNSSYDLVGQIHAPAGTQFFNMHELKLIDNNGRLTALHIGARSTFTDLRDIGHPTFQDGWVGDSGIREVDLHTGETLFEWWPSDHIRPDESYYRDNVSFTDPLKPWNFFHANSVEKNGDGDYLLSARYTSTIYKISGADGHILWRLGGTRSSFHQVGFNFSYQHDARWLSCNDEEEVISFLDNGADSMMMRNTTRTSSALIVRLDKQSTPPTARVLKRWWRPDGQLSRLRGNFQTLSHSGNVVVGWSDNAYITEHDESGRTLLEARFRSDRMVTYRSYKSNFTGAPNEPPDVAAFAFGTSAEDVITVAYMSWNGATEVAAWNMYATAANQSVFLGSTPKTGFETIYQVRGFYPAVFVEAVDKHGMLLPYGRSRVGDVVINVDLGKGAVTGHNGDVSDPVDVAEERIGMPDPVETGLLVPKGGTKDEL